MCGSLRIGASCARCAHGHAAINKFDDTGRLIEPDLISEVRCSPGIEICLIVEPLDNHDSAGRTPVTLKCTLPVNMCSLVRSIGSNDRNAGLGERLVGS